MRDPATRLRQEIDALLDRLSTGRAALERAPRASADDVDRVVAHEQHELDSRAQEAIRTRLRSMQRALTRVAAGEYGECVDCTEPIAPKRLQVIPDAERCLGCAERFEVEQASGSA